ncbi:hypothetical protein IGI04_000949, partial [Brassica rapa subsp. trilocularis]
GTIHCYLHSPAEWMDHGNMMEPQVDLQGCHKRISPLHTELKSLVWALKCFSRHQPAFATELSEFKTLWETCQNAQKVYQSRVNNTQADFARHARTRNSVFSYVNMS